MIDSIIFLNEIDIHEEIQPLFTTRRFSLVHNEILIRTQRLRVATADNKNNINHLGQYPDTLSFSKLTPALGDPIHLRKELVKIKKNFC